MEIITSAQNAIFKQALKLLQNRRERIKTQQTILDGAHLLSAWLDADRTLKRVFISEVGAARVEIQVLLKRIDCPVTYLSTALFAQLTDLPSASGVLALVAIPPAVIPQSSGFVLLLDGVQDPGNVGAILRTAQAAGVEQVLLSAQCADVWSPKVLRAGMGAQAVLPLLEHADLSWFAEQFNGQIAATLLDGAVDLYAAKLQGSLALVLGSEGLGVSAELAEKATLRLKIPMADGIESLNVGHAAAICLYEIKRQNG
ncbi:TrmH family RNA methyltransferase [Deefgea rivuli]|uniref:TrmH family RNA methyltransferase n=1 Tax=Deefgea rivuli TaxID=400948 RepID=UPI000482E700|nr:RNA methyltransferase [Deefgea rivuli]